MSEHTKVKKSEGQASAPRTGSPVGLQIVCNRCFEIIKQGEGIVDQEKWVAENHCGTAKFCWNCGFPTMVFQYKKADFDSDGVCFDEIPF